MQVGIFFFKNKKIYNWLINLGIKSRYDRWSHEYEVNDLISIKLIYFFRILYGGESPHAFKVPSKVVPKRLSVATSDLLLAYQAEDK